MEFNQSECSPNPIVSNEMSLPTTIVFHYTVPSTSHQRVPTGCELRKDREISPSKATVLTTMCHTLMASSLRYLSVSEDIYSALREGDIERCAVRKKGRNETDKLQREDDLEKKLIDEYEELHHLQTAMMQRMGDMAAQRVADEQRKNIYDVIYRVQPQKI